MSVLFSSGDNQFGVAEATEATEGDLGEYGEVGNPVLDKILDIALIRELAEPK